MTSSVMPRTDHPGPRIVATVARRNTHLLTGEPEFKQTRLGLVEAPGLDGDGVDRSL